MWERVKRWFGVAQEAPEDTAVIPAPEAVSAAAPSSPPLSCTVITLKFQNGTEAIYHECLGADLAAALRQSSIRVIKRTQH